MPDTMAWGHSGKCKSCVQPNGPADRNKTPQPPKPAAVVLAPVREDGSKDPKLAHTISGLNSFMAARDQRLRAQASKLAALQTARGQLRPTQRALKLAA